MDTLSITEHSRIAIGDRCDPSRRVITEAQALRLEALTKSLGIRAFDWGRRYVVPRQFVGVYPLGDVRIEVLPKIEGPNKSESNGDTEYQRTSLLELLRMTRRLPIHKVGLAGLATRRSDLLEVYIHVFADGLLAELQRGVIRRYRSVEQNLGVVRGRLLFRDQLRENSVHQERVFCRHQQFMEDTLENQVLKCVSRLLLRQTRNADTQRLLKSSLMILDHVSDVAPSILAGKMLVVDRTILRYKYLLEIAKLVLSGRAHQASAGDALQISLVFDMNTLFEEAVAVAIRRGLRRERSISLKTQGPIKHLLRQGKTPKFRMKPDVTVLADGKPCLILDTKWKLLDHRHSHSGVSQTDLYQIYAYAKRYECRDVVLLYPWHRHLHNTEWQFAIEGSENDTDLPARLWVKTVDLSQPEHLPTLMRELVLSLLAHNSQPA
ncbi:McrC family protein [Bacteroidota bacterium]